MFTFVSRSLVLPAALVAALFLSACPSSSSGDGETRDAAPPTDAIQEADAASQGDAATDGRVGDASQGDATTDGRVGDASQGDATTDGGVGDASQGDATTDGGPDEADAACVCPQLAPCEEAHCTNGQCTPTVLAGWCKIDDVCYSDMEVNPNNPCSICNSNQDQASWSAHVGASCDNDPNDCNESSCDAAGNCVATPLPDFTSCDDGDASTFGDWCYAGVCGGFTQRLLPSDSCDDDDKFYRASATLTTGVHAVYRQGKESLINQCVNVFRVLTLDDDIVHDDQELGSADSGDTIAIWGDDLVISDMLYTKVGSTWTTADVSGTLRRAWNHVSGNGQTRWVGVRFMPTGDRFVGVGREIDGTPIARECAYLCHNGNNCSWFCSNSNISAQSQVSLVDIALVVDQPSDRIYLGGYRLNNSNTSLLPIVDFQQSGPSNFSELDDAGLNQDQTLNDFVEIGTQILGVGDGGLMIEGPPGNMFQTCASFFADYDLLEILTMDDHVFILYTKALHLAQGNGRLFGLAHRPVNSNDCGAWVFHDIIRYVEAGPGGPGNFSGPHNTWDYDYRSLAADSNEMYIVGSWWDTQTFHRVKSYLRWQKPSGQ